MRLAVYKWGGLTRLGNPQLGFNAEVYVDPGSRQYCYASLSAHLLWLNLGIAIDRLPSRTENALSAKQEAE